MRRAVEEAKKAESSKRIELSLSIIYLLLYNGAQALGWLLLTIKLIWQCASNDSCAGLYDEVKLLLNVFQTAALLEVVHAAVGIVRSNLITVATQVSSRVFIVWGILWLIPETRAQVGVPLAVSAWCLTEVIRYIYYMIALVGDVFYSLQWARYTLFIVLYPLGVTGELLCIYTALPYVRHRGTLSFGLPNPANLGFDYSYALTAVMLSYIPLFPQLYSHMLAQRRKIIGGDESSLKHD